MELKRVFNLDYRYLDELLIVPYGIETISLGYLWRLKLQLLIVPYGIETNQSSLLPSNFRPFNRTLWN